MENMEFEEKVDIDNLVLPSKPITLENMDLQSNLTMIENVEFEEKFDTNTELDHDVGKEFKLKMEENILKMYQELDKEKSENSAIEFNLRRSQKIRKFVENIAEHGNVDHRMTSEIVSLKAKIVEVTEEHKSTMSLNAKTMNSIVKMHEKAQEALEHKSNELINIKQELKTVKVTNQELLQKIQGLDMNKNTIVNNDSLERGHEIKPFSCKYCDKSFLHVHEVKKHIEIHTSTSEVEEEKTKGATKNSKLLDHEIQEKKDVGNFEVNNGVLRNCKFSGIKIHSKKAEKAASMEPAIPSPLVDTLKCNYCNKGFSSIGNMKKHMRVVHNACPLCDVVFSTQKSLSEHKLAEHSQKQKTVPNSLKCPTCQLTVKDKKALWNHLVIHKDKTQVCNECGSRFTRKDYLLNHERIHSDEKPFSCKSCDCQFKQQSVLFKHSKICKKSTM